MPGEYGIQSVPPRYEEYDSYYVHNSEGYEKAVDQIDAEEREEAEAETREKENRIHDEEDRRRIEEYNRLRERQILEEINRKEEEIESQSADVSEYEESDTSPPPGTRVDLLA